MTEALEMMKTLGNAKTLLLAIHHAHEHNTPLRGVQLQPDDQPILRTLVEIAYVTQDDVSDVLGISTNGRLAIGLKPAGVIDLPVEVAEVTGNIAERELAARYMEGKIAAIDKAIAKGEAPLYEMTCSWEESYQHAAISFRAAADEFRQGLHLPHTIIAGRVIPYNESNDTGIRHADGLREFFRDVGERNVKAGWWSEIETGEPKKRNLGELLILFVTEIVEAYDAWLDNAEDDKLPQYPGFGVEIGDLLIRAADLCGAAMRGAILKVGPDHDLTANPGEAMFQEIRAIANRYEAIRKTPAAVGPPETEDFLPPMDIAAMVDAKLDFNAHRPDHKIENRLKEDGKRT